MATKCVVSGTINNSHLFLTSSQNKLNIHKLNWMFLLQMKKIVIGLVFIFLFFKTTVSFDSRAIDYMVMVYQWPPAFCQQQQCLSHADENSFKINGFWPAIRGVVDPIFCHDRRELRDEAAFFWIPKEAAFFYFHYLDTKRSSFFFFFLKPQLFIKIIYLL